MTRKFRRKYRIIWYLILMRSTDNKMKQKVFFKKKQSVNVDINVEKGTACFQSFSFSFYFVIEKPFKEPIFLNRTNFDPIFPLESFQHNFSILVSIFMAS